MFYHRTTHTALSVRNFLNLSWFYWRFSALRSWNIFWLNQPPVSCNLLPCIWTFMYLHSRNHQSSMQKFHVLFLWGVGGALPMLFCVLFFPQVQYGRLLFGKLLLAEFLCLYAKTWHAWQFRDPWFSYPRAIEILPVIAAQVFLNFFHLTVYTQEASPWLHIYRHTKYIYRD